jgi:hypothetical protein
LQAAESVGDTHHFRYEVSNYTTPQARPIIYAAGDFLETDLGDGPTTSIGVMLSGCGPINFQVILGHWVR